ncbi:MAG: hypothetical protein R3F55_13175 [Alphaproteobacteria bacterium]
MTETPKSAAALRRERQAAALRANLRRRKAPGRADTGRADAADGPSGRASGSTPGRDDGGDDSGDSPAG